MGIHQALHTAVSGLATNTDGMAVISNNIANANTRSFKTSRAEFEDMLTLNLNENSAIGRGSRLRNVTTNYQQGALASTGILTDLGIQGDGFFCVRNEGMEIKESNAMFYTRQGTFHFDKEGFIADIDGGKLMGYMADEKGRLLPKLDTIQVNSGTIPPSESTIVNVNVNLDTRETSPLDPFDPSRPLETSNHSSTVTIFDNQGNPHVATIYFTRTKDQSVNGWDWNVVVDPREMSDKYEVNVKGEPIPAVIATGNMEFDPSGKPVNRYTSKAGNPTYIDSLNKSDAFNVKFGKGALEQKLQFNFGAVEDDRGVMSTQTSTSMAAKSSTNFHSQDGYEAGSLKSLKVDLNGQVIGCYTNGLQRKLASIALASFANNAGLEKVGRNSFMASPKAGEPRIGVPQTGSRGSIYSMTLEESNVDMAQQFVDMITTQRAFQANSKSVTTTDQMLEEVIGLKR